MRKFSKGWHVLYTRVNQEKKVVKQLNELGIDCYLPVMKVIRQWTDRRKLIESPLFPSYIFVNPCDKNSYYAALESDGAVYYLGSGNEAAKVNDEIIQDIRLSLESGNQVEVLPGNFQKGERISICEGPLAGIDGEIVQYKGRDNIIIRIKMLNRNLLVTVGSGINVVRSESLMNLQNYE